MSEQFMTTTLPITTDGGPIERLGVLFDAHHDRLYRLARRLTPSRDDALDLVQETFLKAARSAKSIPEGATKEEAWLVRVLINLQRDQWRKTSVRDRLNKTAFEISDSASCEGNPEAALIARASIWEALGTLPPRRRAIVILYELEGMTIPGIASLLGISAITVRWHLSVGRSDLARALKTWRGDTHEKP
jgi:RNA polymerase sigma-70 factor (ECF subfamily)